MNYTINGVSLLQQNNSLNMIRFALDYIWVPFIIPIIIYLFKYIFFDKFIRVKEIKKKTDGDIEDFKLLYSSRISKNLRIDSEEIVRFIDHRQKSDIEHHLLICKKWRKVIGFIKFMISREHRYLFVAYIAIDKTDKTARESCSLALIKKMMKKYFKPQIATCIVTEIEQNPNGSPRTSLSKVISRYAKSLNKRAFYIDMPYIQPNMPDVDCREVEESFLSLIYIPYNLPDNLVLPKTKVMDIVQSIYMQIYSPSCNEVACNCAAYNDYLSDRLQDYRSSLGEFVNLVEI